MGRQDLQGQLSIHMSASEFEILLMACLLWNQLRTLFLIATDDKIPVDFYKILKKIQW